MPSTKPRPVQNDDGTPAPWPDDFFAPDTDWRLTGHDNPPTLATNEPPF